MYTVYTVLLPSSKISDLLRSILSYYVDQKPFTWMDVLLYVVLMYEYLELVIRDL